MAGEWLKFEANTPEKPEVFSITAAMGWDDPDLTVGKLLKIWRWFDQQTIEGNAPRVTFPLLDRITGVSGFAQAMCDVGWLAADDDGIRLPNFDRHNGKTAKDRCLTAKRVAKHKTNAGTNGASVSSALPREEKRREEVKNPPIPPAAKATKKRTAIGFPAFIAACKASGDTPIPESHPVFAYASQSGIPEDFLRLQWLEFKDRYGDGEKHYKDWPAVFSKSVRGNWFKLWFIDNNDAYALTTSGKQAEQTHRRTA